MFSSVAKKCKVIIRKTGHDPYSSELVICVDLCVNMCSTTATGVNPITVNKYIYVYFFPSSSLFFFWDLNIDLINNLRLEIHLIYHSTC